MLQIPNQRPPFLVTGLIFADGLKRIDIGTERNEEKNTQDLDIKASPDTILLRYCDTAVLRSCGPAVLHYCTTAHTFILSALSVRRKKKSSS